MAGSESLSRMAVAVANTKAYQLPRVSFNAENKLIITGARMMTQINFESSDFMNANGEFIKSQFVQLGASGFRIWLRDLDVRKPGAINVTMESIVSNAGQYNGLISTWIYGSRGYGLVDVKPFSSSFSP